MARVLVADDAADIRRVLHRMLTKVGHECVEAVDGNSALEKLGEGEFSLILSDVRMPGMDGISLLREIRKRGIAVPIILLTAFANMDDALAAMREGAFDYVTKPFEVEHLLDTVRVALESRREGGQVPDEEKGGMWNILGKSPQVVGIFKEMARLVDGNAPVLIQGESGTGKELVARAIHLNGERKQAPFVPVNCAALPETLLEAELFGHVKGAFTGADNDKPGLFESANGGVLFLDELGEMTPAIQAKLLRVLEDGQVRRVGSRKSTPVDVRIVCATNRDLDAMAEEETFRRDLLYRINARTIKLPALRDREGDIAILFQHFLRRSCARRKQAMPKVEAGVVEKLEGHSWPGNIRELQNVVERAVANSRGNRLRPEDFQLQGTVEETAGPLVTLEEMEKRHIARVLKHTGNHMSNTAKILGIDRKTLGRKVKKYGLG